MSSRQDQKFTNPSILQNLDFKTVKQRLHKITDKIERVRRQSSQVEVSGFIHSEDYAKLLEFMEQNERTESQAIAKILSTFFSEMQLH
jgi:predicted DNA-binding protein (UPF0278 family)